uniref:Xanthine dehydrogenase/oxidase-like n=1 Tax=Saccoglossus kowalevskii TaxID=10224 RepID=A0ABM0M309_SACKO
MTMYTLLRNKPNPTKEEINSALEGIICRCTGYRSVLEGCYEFSKENGCCGGAKTNGCCRGIPSENCVTENVVPNGKSAGDNYESRTSMVETQEPIFPPALLTNKEFHSKTVVFRGDNHTWIRPTTMKQMLASMAQFPTATIVGGNTNI